MIGWTDTGVNDADAHGSTTFNMNQLGEAFILVIFDPEYVTPFTTTEETDTL